MVGRSHCTRQIVGPELKMC